MVRRIAPLIALLAAVAAVAGCGGGGGSATGGESAASLVPASAPIFLALDTNLASAQIKSGDAVLRKFPVRDRVLRGIRTTIAGSGIDLATLQSAAGPEIDIAVLDRNSELNAGFTQPKDEQAFEHLLDTAKPPLKHFTKDGWVVFSDKQKTLDALKAVSDDKLADADTFKAATKDLPAEALAKLYASGSGFREALQAGNVDLATNAVGGNRTKWVSGALFAHDDGIELELRAKGPGASVETQTSTLADEIPAGSVLALVFRSAGSTLSQLRAASASVRTQVEQAVGVSLDELATALSGEGVLWVLPGTPIPEVTLVTKPEHPAQALAVADRVVHKLAPAGTVPEAATVDGIPVKKLDLGAVGIVYGVVDDKLVLSDSVNAIRAVHSGGGGAKLTDDKTFQATKDAAGMPDQTAGWIYINVKDAIPMIEGLADLSGQPLPESVMTNLRPLRGVIGYVTGSGDDAKVSVFVQTS